MNDEKKQALSNLASSLIKEFPEELKETFIEYAVKKTLTDSVLTLAKMAETAQRDISPVVARFTQLAVGGFLSAEKTDQMIWVDEEGHTYTIIKKPAGETQQ